MVKLVPNLFLSFAGNMVVYEVVSSRGAGSLHDSALWLWPPNVLGAVTDCCPPKQPTSRDRLGHRPGWGRVFRRLAERRGEFSVYVAASFSGQRKASPVASIRCMITASLRASATQAFLWLVFPRMRRAQSFRGWALRTTVNRTLAAS